MTGPLTIVILGVGAMACLFGAHLSGVSHANRAPEVFLTGSWREQIEIIQSTGLTILCRDGRETQCQLRVTADLAALPPADIILVLVKSHQTERAAWQARQILSPGGLVITLQNGLDHAKQLSAVIQTERVVAGVTFQGAYLVSPGVLQHAGEGPTYLKSTPGRQSRIADMAELFNAAGIQTAEVQSFEAIQWGKLAVNAAINPLTALLEVRNGALLSDDLYRELMIAAARETARVAAARGIALPYPDIAEHVTQVCRATAANRSSMLQDILRNARTEIEAISGAVVEFGRTAGITTPVNEIFLNLIRQKEAGCAFRTEDLSKLLFGLRKEILDA